MKNEIKKEVFECYSYLLMRFLEENGLNPYKTDQHYTTKKTMWFYKKDDLLDELLTKWKLSNPKNKK